MMNVVLEKPCGFQRFSAKNSPGGMSFRSGHRFGVMTRNIPHKAALDVFYSVINVDNSTLMVILSIKTL